MMGTILKVAEITLAVLLIGAILIQSRGTGLGAAFGGDGGNVYATKRGVEKIVFTATIVISILFFGTTLIDLFV